MPAHERAIRDDNMVPEPAVMGHVAMRHQEVMRAHDGFFGGFVRAMHRDVLPEDIVVPNSQRGQGSAVLQILRGFANHAAGKKAVLCPNSGRTSDVDVWSDRAAMADLHVFIDYRIRANPDCWVELRLRMDYGGLMNHA